MREASPGGQQRRVSMPPKVETFPVSDIRPICLVVRCLLEQDGDQWQAFSLEFGLAAQGESAQQVKLKLESMIEWYVHDALIGEDREHAYELLIRRKVRWPIFLRYYLVWAASHIVMLRTRFGMIYREPLPLVPKHCPA
jgi:hypothetical protein